ncbi:MAG TPA: hypothetical protein VK753_07840 [Xanthomonadaceae bacterium]|jgi:hypothetical protein|nr:hypothetical protein [Xanthomonadaceae bacterium]
MSTAWSAQQQRILSALGHTMYRPAIVPATSVVAMDALLCALVRAAGQDPATMADAEGWLRAQQIPSLASLRSDPSAKRVLWPRLRALRSGRAQR